MRVPSLLLLCLCSSTGFLSASCAVADDETAVVRDAGSDTKVDTGTPDSATPDTGTSDTGTTPDTGSADTGSPTDTGTVEDTGPCAIAGCTTGSESRATCATARTISRKTAGVLGGYAATGLALPTTTIADGSASCAAAGPDHAYRLFVRKGEAIDVTIASKTAGNTLRTLLFESASCAAAACTGTFKCGTTSGGSLTATADGWVAIVVSGATTSDSGLYDITVKLTCKTTDCECP